MACRGLVQWGLVLLLALLSLGASSTDVYTSIASYATSDCSGPPISLSKTNSTSCVPASCASNQTTECVSDASPPVTGRYFIQAYFPDDPTCSGASASVSMILADATCIVQGGSSSFYVCTGAGAISFACSDLACHSCANTSFAIGCSASAHYSYGCSVDGALQTPPPTPAPPTNNSNGSTAPPGGTDEIWTTTLVYEDQVCGGVVSNYTIQWTASCTPMACAGGLEVRCGSTADAQKPSGAFLTVTKTDPQANCSGLVTQIAGVAADGSCVVLGHGSRRVHSCNATSINVDVCTTQACGNCTNQDIVPGDCLNDIRFACDTTQGVVTTAPPSPTPSLTPSLTPSPTSAASVALAIPSVVMLALALLAASV